MAVAELWSRCTNQTLTIPQSRQLTAKTEQWTESQLVWGLAEYMKGAVEPQYWDFVSYMEDVEVPEDLVCKALASDSFVVRQLAGELVALEGAWFPAADRRAGEIREKLERVL